MSDDQSHVADGSVTLNLEGDDLSFSRSISLELAVRVMSFVLAPTSTVVPTTFGNVREERAPKAPLDDVSDPEHLPATPRAALLESHASSNPEKIVALARWHELHENTEGFTLEAVRSLFIAAREAPPANFSRDLTKAIQSGWIAPAGNTRGEYFVTGPALDILSEGVAILRESVQPRSKSVQRAKRPSKPTAKPAIFADVDIVDELDDAPPYHKLKSEKDRLVWALKLADALVQKPLSNKDVAWLTNFLGEGIPIGNVSGAFNGARKQGLVSRDASDNSIRLKPAGHEYLLELARKQN